MHSYFSFSLPPCLPPHLPYIADVVCCCYFHYCYCYFLVILFILFYYYVRSACDDMVTRLYKFYLAFENSLCQDYVTEKFFRFLRRDIVTVALGAGNYSQFVPRDTYIDVRDFRSPKDLASFLKALDTTDKTYEDYLVRKRSLRCEQMWSESHPERLCRHLWDNANTTRGADLSSSLNAHVVCSTPRVFYRGIADTISH